MMPPVMDNRIFAHALLDQFEGRIGGPKAELRWDGQAWIGTDLRQVLAQVRRLRAGQGRVEDGRHELLYDRAISTYVDLQAGLRTDLDSGNSAQLGRVWRAGPAPRFSSILKRQAM